MIIPDKFVTTKNGWIYYCLWNQRWPGYDSADWIEVVW